MLVAGDTWNLPPSSSQDLDRLWSEIRALSLLKPIFPVDVDYHRVLPSYPLIASMERGGFKTEFLAITASGFPSAPGLVHFIQTRLTELSSVVSYPSPLVYYVLKK